GEAVARGRTLWGGLLTPLSFPPDLQLDALEEEEQGLILDCAQQFSQVSARMADLSEVLALRTETQDQRRREVTQLRTQVLMLQCCCQTVGLVVCGAPSSLPGPIEAQPPPPCPGRTEQPGPRPLCAQSQNWRTSESVSFCPLVVPGKGPKPREGHGVF
ncbi:uncharacterized protein LOC101687210, partial [Mustela putorius furo]|uniref:Uncharacterized protein LOC101687210 n=1 Tax=Mustela putorius furo TaxID=9669 RepID=A0A8U0S619_MUSPF